MKQKIKLLIILGLMCGCLSACGGDNMTQADKCWVDAQSAGSLEEYLKSEGDLIDWETLRQEAKNEELSLKQRFRAVNLLCAFEYQSFSETDESEASSYDHLIGEENIRMFRMDYPDSSAYANAYLKKVNTAEEEFWEAFVVAFGSCDYLNALVAAADELDGQTIVNLVKGLNEDEMWGMKLKAALVKWVKAHPGGMEEYIEELIETGFYEDWDIFEWKREYFYNKYDPYLIKTATIDDALSYISSVREILIPWLASEFGEEFEKRVEQRSEFGEGNYYETMLTVGADEALSLHEVMEDGHPEAIELEDKKVIAFYRNPSAEEFSGSPTTLRILGDFMLGLSEEEYPKTIAEADYYLVLTALYEYGGRYQDSYGNETNIQWFFSRTSVDLYEAKTGRFLCHLGNLLEEAPDTVTVWSDEENVISYYPEPVSADVLSYIYHSINEPEKYSYLMDSASGGSGVQPEE